MAATNKTVGNPAQSGDKQFKSLVEGLFTLEVNTIVSDNISAEKMPPPERAIPQIAQSFDVWLAEHGAPRPDDDRGGVVASKAAFASFAARARNRIKAIEGAQQQSSFQPVGQPSGDGDHLELLYRIRDDADAIVRGIFDRPRDKPLPDSWTEADASRNEVELLPEELMLIRKIWDLGLDRIAMQTVIQLDGDVLTRVRPAFARDPAILDIHNRGIMLSMQVWQSLVDVVGRFIESAARLVLGR